MHSGPVETFFWRKSIRHESNSCLSQGSSSPPPFERQIRLRPRKTAAQLSLSRHRLKMESCRRRFPVRQAQRFSAARRSEEHTSELQSLMRISYAVFCLKKTNRLTTISANQMATIHTQIHSTQHVI